VKLRNDMPDDILRDAIETSKRVIQEARDFESEGIFIKVGVCNLILFLGLACAEKIKNEFDARWSPYWHCVIGRNFGSFVTHETKKFAFFYIGDKAVMLFKAG
jgi:hypothetical protein